MKRKAEKMGEIRARLELENFGDRHLARLGKLAEAEVRRHALEGVVDTGAVMLMLPQEAVEKLGLTILRKVVVTYADDRREERPVAGTVTVKIGDRSMNTDCVVGPPLTEALIGQIILEEMDLVADCQTRALTVRPESPIYPSLKMK